MPIAQDQILHADQLSKKAAAIKPHKFRSRSNLRGLPREPKFFLFRFRALYK